VPNIESFSVDSLTVDGKRIDRACRIVRLGNDYLIPLVAVNVLFDLEVKTEDEGERIFISDNNFTIQMRLYDPLVIINQEKKLLRTPPIYSQTPMVPIRLFKKVFHKKIRFYPSLKQKKLSKLQSLVTSALMEKITLLNILAGALFTCLWISIRLIMRKHLETRFWRIAPYMLLGLLMLLYIVQVITARIERLYF